MCNQQSEHTRFETMMLCAALVLPFFSFPKASRRVPPL